MFIANFSLKTSIQKFLFTVRDFHDFPTLASRARDESTGLRESVEYAQKNMRRAVGVEELREVLAMALEQVSVEGHYLEFGVFKGGTIRYIAGKAPKSHAVHGFDSFEGLSEALEWRPWALRRQGPTAEGSRQCGACIRATSPIRCRLDREASRTRRRLSMSTAICTNRPGTSSSTSAIESCWNGDCVRRVLQLPELADHEFLAFQEFVARRGIRYQYLAYARFQVGLKITDVAG